MQRESPPSRLRAAANEAEMREDRLLGGRVRLVQPCGGLRATTDSVMLAAAVPAREGQRILDVGCGSGVIALCVAARVPHLDLHGLESESGLAGLAAHNAELNRVERWQSHVGDLYCLPESLARMRFDIVCTNPPWILAGRPSPDAARRMARAEAGAGFEAWLAACMRLLRPGGSLVAVFPRSRLAEAARAMGGAVLCRPFAPRKGKPQHRILARAPGEKEGIRWLPEVVVHSGDSYSDTMRGVLWDAEPIGWGGNSERPLEAGLA